MTVGSRLYEGRVVHERFAPRKHRFSYGLFQFALDLDQIDALAEQIPWLSRNRFNLYSFHDVDHLSRERVEALLRAHGVAVPITRLLLVTNLRVLGYVFNPVSFFYAYGADGTPLGAVAEVNNTFGDTKCYVLTERVGEAFTGSYRKDFYISPFVARDSTLDLRAGIPGERLAVAILDGEAGVHVLTATLSMKARALTSASLLWMAVRHPLITLKVIGAIHWEALRLFLKKIPWRRYA